MPLMIITDLPCYLEYPECRNCHQPFLLNHQCDESYDELDDDSEFGDDSDGSDYIARYLRLNEALDCECSVHCTLDRSPQPKKPRNSWRQHKYPEDCNLTSLINGEVTIGHLSMLRKTLVKEKVKRKKRKEKNERGLVDG